MSIATNYFQGRTQYLSSNGTPVELFLEISGGAWYGTMSGDQLSDIFLADEGAFIKFTRPIGDSGVLQYYAGTLIYLSEASGPAWVVGTFLEDGQSGAYWWGGQVVGF